MALVSLPPHTSSCVCHVDTTDGRKIKMTPLECTLVAQVLHQISWKSFHWVKYWKENAHSWISWWSHNPTFTVLNKESPLKFRNILRPCPESEVAETVTLFKKIVRNLKRKIYFIVSLSPHIYYYWHFYSYFSATSPVGTGISFHGG